MSPIHHAFALGGALLLVAVPAAAQLSPGKLARAHTDLEGSAHCLDCHRSGKGVEGGLCLGCHTLLGERLAAGRGLHAQPEYRDCQRCHIEHQGLDFELVWWGQGGQEAFDHHLAGYPLLGKHARLGCRECHKPELLTQPERLRERNKDLMRTFLGLETACLACHRDPHRGQLGDAACTSCHGQEAWKPAAGFDHGTSRYPLTGRHRQVACDRCHPGVRADGGTSYIRYTGIAADTCQSCHRDPHTGRLGSRCQSCHTTAGWRVTDPRAFDHERARYPLRGRHQTVSCERCHKEGLLRPITGFDRCATCHADIHLGQFRDRPGGGACDTCHTVNRFAPVPFTLEDHQKTRYPLEGSHLAVPCNACHRRVPAARLAFLRPPPPAGSNGAGGGGVLQFRFAGTRCMDCHEDLHDGRLARYQRDVGCVACHDLRSWLDVRFEHSASSYPLVGRHQEITCQGCHPRIVASGRWIRLQLSGLGTGCHDCHEDPHIGQLDAPGASPSCDRCHGTEGWKQVRFDHDRDAAFRLQGAHARVPCASCHPTEQRWGESVVRYRPVGGACTDCHPPEVARSGL